MKSSKIIHFPYSCFGQKILSTRILKFLFLPILFFYFSTKNQLMYCVCF